MNKALAILALVAITIIGLAVAAASCAARPAWDPVRQAEAQATASAAGIAEANARLDLDVRRAELEREAEAHEVALEATVSAYRSEVLVNAVRADAQASATRALGGASRVALPILAIGLSLAILVLAGGFCYATVRRAAIASSVFTVGVDPRTMLPPPLVITNDGWLVDTRSGERARLRDPAGVDRLRLAATTHATEVAQLAAAQVEIAKATRDAQPADALMSGASALPFVVEN